MNICDRKSDLFYVDFASMHPYTRYPFALMLPQHLLEGIFRDKCRGHTVDVFRPYRMVGMCESAQPGMAEVSFEGDAVIRARYVIGADGSHSTVYYFFRSQYKRLTGMVLGSAGCRYQILRTQLVVTCRWKA